MAKNRLIERRKWIPMTWVEMDSRGDEDGDGYCVIHYDQLFKPEKEACTYITKFISYLVCLNKGKFDVKRPDYGDR